jgi:hypothetical protein
MVKSPEHVAQVGLIKALNYLIRPEIVRFAIPNGGRRHIGVAKKMKAEGLLAGMPDLGFAVEDGRVHWLEMKAPEGVISENQRGVLKKLAGLGHNTAVAWSVEEAIEYLRQWGCLK